MPNKNRQRGESISQWRNRLRNQNMLGVYGGELEPAVVTADRPDQKPTGNWFKRIKKFRYPYGRPIDAIRTWNAEESQLLKETLDKEALRDPKHAEDVYNKIRQHKTYTQMRDALKRRTDEYRGNYASSLLPFKYHSNPNDILSQLQRAYSRHFGYNTTISTNNVNFSNKGTDIIDLDRNVIRLSPSSTQSTALFNEFVESKRPSVHPASEYQQGHIKRFGDIYNVPVENVSLFAGIEDGHYKVDSLQNFNPKTIIYPARNIKRGVLPITSIKIKDIEESPTNDDGKHRYWQELSRNLDPWWYSKYSKDENGFYNVSPKEWNSELESKRQAYREAAADKIDSLLNVGQRAKAYELMSGNTYNYNDPIPTSWIRTWNGYYRNSFSPNDYYELPEVISMRDSLLSTRRKIPSFKIKNERKYFYIDTKGEEHPISDYNASILDSKMVLGNPNGGKFIGRIQDISTQQLNALNNWLQKNPSWLVRPDLGSFSQYRLDSPSLTEYLKQYFEHPKADDPNVYTIGTTEPNKLW